MKGLLLQRETPVHSTEPQVQQEEGKTLMSRIDSQIENQGHKHTQYPWGAPECEYSMEAKLNTIKEVWEEYFIGINGKMSIVEKERTVKDWRQVARVDRRFFFKRKMIWEVIESVARVERLSVTDVVAMFQHKQSRNKMSIARMRDWIDKVRKQATLEVDFVALIVRELRTL